MIYISFIFNFVKEIKFTFLKYQFQNIFYLTYLLVPNLQIRYELEIETPFQIRPESYISNLWLMRIGSVFFLKTEFPVL